MLAIYIFATRANFKMPGLRYTGQVSRHYRKLTRDNPARNLKSTYILSAETFNENCHSLKIPDCRLYIFMALESQIQIKCESQIKCKKNEDGNFFHV